MTTIIFLALSLTLQAPALNQGLIFKSEALNPYERIIDAVTFVESAHGEFTYNKTENAVGWFQVRQIRVDDYNMRTAGNYSLVDFYDYELSRKMFLYYASAIGFRDAERVCREWNGSGRQTDIYWMKITNYLRGNY